MTPDDRDLRSLTLLTVFVVALLVAGVYAMQRVAASEWYTARIIRQLNHDQIHPAHPRPQRLRDP